MAKTWCQACGERQFNVHGNESPTCANGHGGAPGLNEQEALALGYDVTRRLRRVITVPRAEQHIPKRATIRRRSQEEAELSDATCTPKWLADHLFETHGPFDFDPCSNFRSHIVAHWVFSLEKGLDGTKLAWNGSGFMNNPYSAPLVWMEKARHEMLESRCTELVVLCKMDPSTRWWPVITTPMPIDDRWYSPDLWLFDDRIQFEEHPDLIEKRRCEVAAGTRKGAKSGKSSNNFCSVMIHWRFELPKLQLEKYATLWRHP